MMLNEKMWKKLIWEDLERLRLGGTGSSVRRKTKNGFLRISAVEKNTSGKIGYYVEVKVQIYKNISVKYFALVSTNFEKIAQELASQVC
jgi:hypothetical protein